MVSPKHAISRFSSILLTNGQCCASLQRRRILFTSMHCFLPRRRLRCTRGWRAALASFNIRGAAGQVLAKIVREYIWVGALAALNAANLCHFDITEHNVVVAADRTSAKLVDLESVTGVGQPATNPTAAIKGVRPALASVAFDEQCVCAILHCLWDADVTSFGGRSSFVAQFGADDERQRFVDKIASENVLVV
jgi:hypothetical protein